MPSQSRKHRGLATQGLVARWFAARGWPFAESTGSGRSGVDVTGMPGLSAEVKATAGDVTGALHQAHRNRGGGLPFVVWRPNGYGPERIEQWPVIMRLDDFTALLTAAGYGDEAATDQGDVPDDGANDDPWTDPPQPVTIPCPGEPTCVLTFTGHVHLEHP